MRAPTNLVTRDVMILTPASTVDRYGDTIADWSTPTSRAAKVWAAQTSSSADNDHRSAVTTLLHATFLLSAELVAGERVALDGVTYDVVGEPNYAPTPTGPNHIECNLAVVVG